MALSGLPPPSLRLLLFICLLSPSRPETSTSPNPTSEPTTESPNANTTFVTSAPSAEQNTTGAECLIDNQMGLIAIGSAGGLIVCLLFTVITLACQVHQLRRRVYIPRSSRSNLDIAGSAGYWANAAAAMERAGDASVMMDEMKTAEGAEEREGEELGEIREEEEDEEEEEEEEGGAGVSPEEKPLMHTSESRESDLPQDLENIPLVV
ncbi:hypothetical protein NL108_012541 [Boleophthalmus pectinirostris]|uniref:cyclin-dependent kinase 11A-like n=1 Tax=Boleophthalmus pectinirostris TaxID=150288 RepID=UPI002432A382|nr:cyclin-dependent kinase 11A-like [Boleophthalmus pectinirostris]XP_055004080.1 cyclin-dependent kinase 11A-like [Boleophthalmus pectinirostris]XP_055004081.1 cyclin-dependent kinase 11A-like [Boleophthalmus pectinirostris]KAJ0063850.1 hypothetical protein NL108_012541 [Boleophthalmus pectinirostris]